MRQPSGYPADVHAICNLLRSAIVDLFLTVTDHFRTGEPAFNDYGCIGWVSRAAMKLVPQGTSKAFSNTGFADARQPESGIRG